MEHLVLETTKFVIEKSERVSINRDAIEKIARQWKKEKWEIPPWDFSYHFFDGSERTLTYLFILDSINFSFWTDKKEQKYRRPYQSREIDGYNALALSLKLAFLQKHPVEKTAHLLILRKGDFYKLLDGKGNLPLLEKRLNCKRVRAKKLKSAQTPFGQWNI